MELDQRLLDLRKPHNADYFSLPVMPEVMIAELNHEKTVLLNERIHQLEIKLAKSEEDFLRKHDVPHKSNVSKLLHRRFYNELDDIDNLFVKMEYFDEKGKNLILDTIEERLEGIEGQIKVP